MESMERFVQKRLKNIIVCFFLVFFSCIFFPQTSFAHDVGDKIRIPLWAELEAYPGTGKAVQFDDDLFAYPISRLKEVAPFFIEGMVCGWSFSYTPSDKTRGVPEHFDFVPLYDFDSLPQKIVYKEPWIKDSRLYCWAEFTTSSQEAAWRKAWETSVYRRISGKGKGLLSAGFDGIKEAALNALKSAVREHARMMTKNKPKEIIGEILITGEPLIGIRSGRYVVELDFFLNISRIIEYNIY